MPLDPQAHSYLERLAATRFGQLHELPLGPTRAAMRQLAAALAPTLPAAADVYVTERYAETPAGTVPVRVYHPEPSAILPVTVFFHGGGFVLGDLDTHDALARDLAVATGTVLVSVDYPLAPENKYPAAPDAAVAATRWVAANASDLGGDGTRLAVAGDSAGGNLATVVAMRARDAGGPAVAFQLLIYPDLDFRRSNDSIRGLAGQFGNISRETQFWFMDSYLPDASQRTLPHVSPLLAADLDALPPALIITAEYDALRDEGEQYGDRLAAAGVPVTVTRYDGMIHEFLRHGFDASRRAITEAGAAVRAALAPVAGEVSAAAP
jgi:acetyl esterase